MTSLRFTLLASILLFCMGAGDSAISGDVIAILREFGFPIFVSLWFMGRIEKRLDRFTDTVQNLLTAVTIMAKTLDDLSHSTEKVPTQLP